MKIKWCIMKQESTLKVIEQKTFRESQQDGLLELVMGLCMVLMSSRLLSPALVGMLALPAVLFWPVLEAMRRRFTYPRVGYVKLIPDKPKDVIRGIFLVTLVVLVVLGVALWTTGKIRDFDLWMRWCPFWGGTVLAGMFSSFASKSGSARYTLFALWSFASGFVLSVLKFEEVETGTLLYFAVMGLVLIPFGMARFVSFLHKYPKPVEGTHNDLFN